MMSHSTHVDGDRRCPRPVLQFLLLMALLCAPVAGAAQVDEVAAGAGGNAVLRGPWVTSGWRKPLPRLALFLVGSLIYERFVDHSGWNWSDFNQRLASYLLAEAAVTGIRRLERKRVSAPPTGLALFRGDPWCPGPPGGRTLALSVPRSVAADSSCGVPLRR